MKIPTLEGLIRRRILVNYRVEPNMLQKILPAPFRPKLINGVGIAGICLIRLEQIHPRLIPVQMGFASENAAHRIAVTWNENGETREGVYIPRRDTSSLLNFAAGGTLFPGVHHHSQFETRESERDISIHMHNQEDGTHLELEAEYDTHLPTTSIFDSLTDASKFFEGGAVGYSVTPQPHALDAIELRTFGWKMEPLRVTRVVSSFYANPAQFPNDAIQFDCALAMRNLQHEWHARDSFHIEPLREHA